jgi:hypothetical protein
VRFAGVVEGHPVRHDVVFVDGHAGDLLAPDGALAAAPHDVDRAFDEVGDEPSGHPECVVAEVDVGGLRELCDDGKVRRGAPQSSVEVGAPR